MGDRSGFRRCGADFYSRRAVRDCSALGKLSFSLCRSEHIACGGRGLCNFATATCVCYEGYMYVLALPSLAWGESSLMLFGKCLRNVCAYSGSTCDAQENLIEGDESPLLHLLTIDPAYKGNVSLPLY